MGNPVVVDRYAIAVGQLIDEGRVGGIADNSAPRPDPYACLGPHQQSAWCAEKRASLKMYGP
jgi:hypothetical protein